MFKTKARRNRVLRSAPGFKTEPLQTDSGGKGPGVSPSKYMSDVLKRTPTFGVYQDDNGLFKVGSSTFKYNDTHVYVDGTKYKATHGLWELLTKSRPDANIITQQDKEAYKHILVRSNAHRYNYSPSGKIKANKGFKYTKFISPLFKRKLNWETLE
jgi:hypothetical protein